MKSYPKRAEEFRNYNLSEAGNYYGLDPEDQEKDVREKLEKVMDMEEGYNVVVHSTDLCLAGIESYELPDGTDS